MIRQCLILEFLLELIYKVHDLFNISPSLPSTRSELEHTLNKNNNSPDCSRHSVNTFEKMWLTTVLFISGKR